MTATLIIQQLITQLVIPVCLAAASGFLAWAGYEGKQFIQKKTGNAEAAAAVERFGVAMSGAVATMEQRRIEMSPKLTQTEKDALLNGAVNTAWTTAGPKTMKAIESKFDNVQRLAEGMAEAEVAKVKTDKTKL